MPNNEHSTAAKLKYNMPESYAKLKHRETELQKELENNLFAIGDAKNEQQQTDAKNTLKKTMREITDVRKKLLALLNVK